MDDSLNISEHRLVSWDISVSVLGNVNSITKISLIYKISAVFLMLNGTVMKYEYLFAILGAVLYLKFA